MRKPSTKIAHSQSENAVLNPAAKVLRAVAKERWKWTLKGALSFHAVAFSDSLEASDSNSRPSGRDTPRAKPLLTPCSSPELSARGSRSQLAAGAGHCHQQHLWGSGRHWEAAPHPQPGSAVPDQEHPPSLTEPSVPRRMLELFRSLWITRFEWRKSRPCRH